MSVKKKYFAFFLFLAAAVLPFFVFGVKQASADNDGSPVVLQLFYSKACPHCEKEILFLNDLKKEISCLEIVKYEVQESEANRNLFAQSAQRFGIKNLAVPLTIVGDKYLLGFDSAENMGQQIREMVETEISECSAIRIEPSVSRPIFGKINLEKASLPFLTFALGIMDGFNPCSMWALLTLMALVLATGSRKKIWLVGGVFIIISSISYFLFMTAWLNAFVFAGYIKIVRIAIGGLAIIAGLISIREFNTFKPGVCEISSSEKQLKIIDKMNNVLGSATFPLVILGVATIAFSVNMVELLCSLGLPVVYTGILAARHLATWQYYAYILLYVFFYMLDDIVVVLAAGISMKFLDLNGKYSRYSRLLVGLLMLILGILFILKPSLLSLG